MQATLASRRVPVGLRAVRAEYPASDPTPVTPAAPLPAPRPEPAPTPVQDPSPPQGLPPVGDPSAPAPAVGSWASRGRGRRPPVQAVGGTSSAGLGGCRRRARMTPATSRLTPIKVSGSGHCPRRR